MWGLGRTGIEGAQGSTSAAMGAVRVTLFDNLGDSKKVSYTPALHVGQCLVQLG